MKFSVGYKLEKDCSFIEYLAKNKERINEVYFSWSDFASGRNKTIINEDFFEYEALEKENRDLSFLAENGMKTNILFNANCYGAESQSRVFFNKIGDTVEYCKRFNVVSVTTASFLIAKFIKENFPELDCRASVNMGVCSLGALRLAEKYFDSFYLARELNRDKSKAKELCLWCRQNGKGVYGLANSGCFSFCPARTFHDNLVAHESEIAKEDNGYAFNGLCAEYLKSGDKSCLVGDMNYIRPEDVGFYEEIFDGLKLATRVSFRPIQTVKAYLDGHYTGNVLDLLEPNHSANLYPLILENRAFPKGFVEKVSCCDKNCISCGYCKKVYNDCKVELDIKEF